MRRKLSSFSKTALILYSQIRRRVILNAVIPTLKVEMSAEGISRVAHVCYQLASLNIVADVYKQLTAMGVQCGVAVAVVNHNMIAPAGSPVVCPVSSDNSAGFCGDNVLSVGAAVAGQVESLVVSSVAPVGGYNGTFRGRPLIISHSWAAA